MRHVNSCLLIRTFPFVSLIRLKKQDSHGHSHRQPPLSNSGSAHSPSTLLNKYNHMVTNRKLVVHTLQNTRGKDGLLLILPPALALWLRLTSGDDHSDPPLPPPPPPVFCRNDSNILGFIRARTSLCLSAGSAFRLSAPPKKHSVDAGRRREGRREVQGASGGGGGDPRPSDRATD